MKFSFFGSLISISIWISCFCVLNPSLGEKYHKKHHTVYAIAILLIYIQKFEPWTSLLKKHLYIEETSINLYNKMYVYNILALHRQLDGRYRKNLHRESMKMALNHTEETSSMVS